MKKIVLFALIFLFTIATVHAQAGHMSLLAVAQDSEGNYSGSVADLYLTVKKGEGRVFLETFPLSKADTQMSTRFAKEVACKFLDKDCNKYDFFYTIQSDASIIGGPSAGGAISVLTVAVLDKQEMNEEVAMTGTINSGDLIGPVGHIKEKIMAAKQQGMTKVLIPSGQRFEEIETNTNETNSSNKTTIDLVEFGQTIGIEVKEVVGLRDAINEFTDKQYEEEYEDFEVDENYATVMQKLGLDLCEHAETIEKELNLLTFDENITENYENAINLTEKADASFLVRDYYAGASFCFSAGVEFRKIQYQIEEMNETERAKELKQEINEFEKNIKSRSKDTITDLQAYMIVKERLFEASEALETGNSSNTLAYVTERFYSAGSWSKFFGAPGRQFELEEENLKDSCMNKLNEVEERIQFVEIFFPSIAAGIRDNFVAAYEYFLNDEYALCLFKASKTKAEANVLVSVVGVGEEEFDKVVENKFLSAKRAIAKQTAQEMFPIIAYSYYEYGNSLKEDDKYSGLVYAEYALELSNLDIYFKQKKHFDFDLDIDFWKVWILILGIVIGFILGKTSTRKQVQKSVKIKLKLK